MYSNQQKAFCIEELIKEKTIPTVQREFRLKFQVNEAPAGSIMREWLEMFRRADLMGLAGKYPPHASQVRKNEKKQSRKNKVVPVEPEEEPTQDDQEVDEAAVNDSNAEDEEYEEEEPASDDERKTDPTYYPHRKVLK